MARDRLLLHADLKAFLGNDHVYFQPPASVKIEYPAIIYEIDRRPIKSSGDSNAYMLNHGYSLILVTKDPDSTLPDDILSAFRMITFDRHYVSDGLIHDVYTLYE